jgi:hypothetical protein
MSEETLLQWLSRNLPGVLTTPIDNDRRLQSSRELIQLFVNKVSDLPFEERDQILGSLNHWIATGQIDGYNVPADKETFSWMEGIVGTLIGIVEE